MECEKLLVKLYEKTLSHHKELLELMKQLTQEQINVMEQKYGHDMKRNFDPEEIRFKIRESSDRLYHLDKVIQAYYREQISNNESECEHEYVIDFIDVSPDKSMTIRYCSKCEKTLD